MEKEKSEQHLSTDYHSKLANGNVGWVCPKCLDICNCANCRRKKGLSPTGQVQSNLLIGIQLIFSSFEIYQVYRKVKKMGYSSVHEYLKNDDKSIGNEDEMEEETEGEDQDEDSTSEKQSGDLEKMPQQRESTKDASKTHMRERATAIKEEEDSEEHEDEEEEEEETDETNDLGDEEDNDDDFVDGESVDSPSVASRTTAKALSQASGNYPTTRFTRS